MTLFMGWVGVGKGAGGIVIIVVKGKQINEYRV